MKIFIIVIAVVAAITIFLSAAMANTQGSSYEKACNIDGKIQSLIKTELQEGKTAEQIRDYLEKNKEALYI